MSDSPSFDDIFAVMASASLRDMTARVVVPENASVDETATRFAIGLNILLDDLTLELTAREKLAARLQIIAESARDFSAATSDIGHLLDVVARRLGELVGDMCVIRPVSEDGEWLELTEAVYHRDPELLATAREILSSDRQRVGEGFVGRSAATGQPVLIPKIDTTAFAASTEPQYQPLIERLGVASAMALPLQCRGKVVGVACLLRSKSSHSYNEDDLRFVQSIADHAALALGNARSYAAERAARDVAEKATSALRLSEARFSRLREAGIIGIIGSKIDGEVTEINDTLLHLVGYSRDEILSGQVPWKGLTPPEWHCVDAQAVEQLRSSGVARLREKEYRRKDGTLVPVLAGSAVIEPGKDEYISFVLDLTERKQAYAAIAQMREERAADDKIRALAAIVDASDDAIVGKTLDGVITSWNQGAHRIFGYTAPEVVGKSISVIIPPALAEEERVILATAARGEVKRFETVRRCKSGRVIEVSVTTSPVFDAGGGVVGISKVARDITDRKQAEQERARLAAIVDFSNDAIVGLTTDGVITSWNRGAHHIFGYSAEEVIGHVGADTGILPSGVGPDARVIDALATGTVKTFDAVRRRKDGKEIAVSVTVSPLRDAAGQLIGISGILRDVTERRQAEVALALAKESAEAANRELEAFSYSVAHDLRAPLRGMNGFAQLLLDRYTDKLDERGRDWLSKIVFNANKMGELIDGLLALARVTRSELKIERVDLSEIVREAATRLRAAEPHRTININVQSDLHAEVDPRLARVLFDNLLGNAWKFTSKAPNAAIEFGAVEKDGAFPFFVRDNGAGFDMAFADKLFAVFQRLHTVDEFPGTGIGLATVQRIVHRHGGRVWAEGSVDRGATFYFTFAHEHRGQ